MVSLAIPTKMCACDGSHNRDDIWVISHCFYGDISAGQLFYRYPTSTDRHDFLRKEALCRGVLSRSIYRLLGLNVLGPEPSFSRNIFQDGMFDFGNIKGGGGERTEINLQSR